MNKNYSSNLSGIIRANIKIDELLLKKAGLEECF
jgi:hypothetical protein